MSEPVPVGHGRRRVGEGGRGVAHRGRLGPDAGRELGAELGAVGPGRGRPGVQGVDRDEGQGLAGGRGGGRLGPDACRELRARLGAGGAGRADAGADGRGRGTGGRRGVAGGGGGPGRDAPCERGAEGEARGVGGRGGHREPRYGHGAGDDARRGKVGGHDAGTRRRGEGRARRRGVEGGHGAREGLGERLAHHGAVEGRGADRDEHGGGESGVDLAPGLGAEDGEVVGVEAVDEGVRHGLPRGREVRRGHGVGDAPAHGLAGGGHVHGAQGRGERLPHLLPGRGHVGVADALHDALAEGAAGPPGRVGVAGEGVGQGAPHGLVDRARDVGGPVALAGCLRVLGTRLPEGPRVAGVLGRLLRLLPHDLGRGVALGRLLLGRVVLLLCGGVTLGVLRRLGRGLGRLARVPAHVELLDRVLGGDVALHDGVAEERGAGRDPGDGRIDLVGGEALEVHGAHDLLDLGLDLLGAHTRRDGAGRETLGEGDHAAVAQGLHLLRHLVELLNGQALRVRHGRHGA